MVFFFMMYERGVHDVDFNEAANQHNTLLLRPSYIQTYSRYVEVEFYSTGADRGGSGPRRSGVSSSRPVTEVHSRPSVALSSRYMLARETGRSNTHMPELILE